MKTKLFFLFAAFALLLSVNAVAQSNGDVNAPAYYYYIGQDPITADNYTTLAETSDTLLKEKEYTTERYGYMYVLCPNSVTSIKGQQPGIGFWSDDSFIIDISVSIPGHTVFKTTGNCGAYADLQIEFDYTPVAETYYYYYSKQNGTLANPSSPINGDNYKTLAESSTTLKDSMTIKTEKGWMYVLVPNTVTEIKLFVPALQAYSSVKFNVVDTSIPGHVVYKSESAASSGNGRLDFTYGEVDNNYYYYYGIQEGTVQNPSSPINADNYKTLAESSTTLKDSMTITAKKGYAYVLVPNSVTEVKWFDLNANAYSTVKFNVIDTSIPGHLVYKSETPSGGGNVRLDFTSGGCNVILDRTSVERVIYDMRGRKLTDVEKLRSGIYIVNGRKLIVK